MTETGWTTSTDPEGIMESLLGSGMVNGRKFQLFACACGRRAWPHISKRSHRVIEVAESLADGLASREQFEKAVRSSGVWPGWDASLEAFVLRRAVLRARARVHDA
jgi:hypothetical protein